MGVTWTPIGPSGIPIILYHFIIFFLACSSVQLWWGWWRTYTAGLHYSTHHQWRRDGFVMRPCQASQITTSDPYAVIVRFHRLQARRVPTCAPAVLFCLSSSGPVRTLRPCLMTREWDGCRVSLSSSSSITHRVTILPAVLIHSCVIEALWLGDGESMPRQM